MARFNLAATQFDRDLAKAIEQHASPTIEHLARGLTWTADEHVLLVAAAGLWLVSHGGDRSQRRLANHLVASVVATAILPHAMKRVIAQERPDRCMVHGRRRGIPRSGKAYDAFPWGHAMHMGALASAAAFASARAAPLAWTIASVVAATRIILLAHWATDVLAGLALGACVERILRPRPEASENLPSRE